MAIVSPWTLGAVATRKSSVRPLSRPMNEPSSGFRFSAMSMSESTLTHEIIGAASSAE